MYVYIAAEKNYKPLLSALYSLHYQGSLPPEGKGKHSEAVECIIRDGADIPTSQVRSGRWKKKNEETSK